MNLATVQTVYINFSTPIKFCPYGADLRQLRRGGTPAGAAYERQRIELEKLIYTVWTLMFSKQKI